MHKSTLHAASGGGAVVGAAGCVWNHTQMRRQRHALRRRGEILNRQLLQRKAQRLELRGHCLLNAENDLLLEALHRLFDVVFDCRHLLLQSRDVRLQLAHVCRGSSWCGSSSRLSRLERVQDAAQQRVSRVRRLLHCFNRCIERRGDFLPRMQSRRRARSCRLV